MEEVAGRAQAVASLEMPALCMVSKSQKGVWRTGAEVVILEIQVRCQAGEIPELFDESRKKKKEKKKKKKRKFIAPL